MSQDLSQLLERCLEILRREITNITLESTKKLSASSARDLVAYTKLLSEIQEQEMKAAKGLSKLSAVELEELKRKSLEALSRTDPSRGTKA
jgi:hypothetical protein